MALQSLKEPGTRNYLKHNRQLSALPDERYSVSGVSETIKESGLEKKTGKPEEKKLKVWFGDVLVLTAEVVEQMAVLVSSGLSACEGRRARLCVQPMESLKSHRTVPCP
ncbi:hypothetical protein PHYPO_G00212440 [Pangasianodon hypophthalmus]|uniref:Uncharacterized protein n=1 Tax=Pangasianodon hypophthalmus TaxID=310915 RepID=A0A5N5P549_PANHP|nr:hypothetical protein PHYPO_G00212440 [Pangasianodon hypophthalmus]